jgi:RIO kinase 1
MSNRKQFRELDELDELEILDQKDPVEETLDHFFAEGMITEILYLVKSGKEATVYCCEAHPSTGMELIAAKIYRSRNQRNFKNDAIYLEGRVIGKARVRRAVENKSRFGREAGFGMWVNSEFETLTALSRAGADIPHPIARTQTTILMEYFGDREAAAPSLGSSQLSRDQAEAAFDNLLGNIELWLAHNYIHGDLSAYNVLYWQGQAKTIDFPQAVDPRFNPNALLLLTRDVENICRYFTRYGLDYDGRRIAERLWHRFRRAQL